MEKVLFVSSTTQNIHLSHIWLQLKNEKETRAAVDIHLHDKIFQANQNISSQTS
jgi:hypothetical protein